MNLYVCVALPPGERKSPVFTQVFTPINALERQRVANTEDARTKERAERDRRIQVRCQGC